MIDERRRSSDQRRSDHADAAPACHPPRPAADIRSAAAMIDLRILATAVLLGLLLWTLAYQVPTRLDLAVGGDSASQRREDDQPFLHSVHASEPAAPGRYDWWNLDPGYTYRWTTNDTRLNVPGIGGGRWIVTLLVSSGRPDGTPAISTWQTADRTLPPLTISANPRLYHVLAPADGAGNLWVRMDTQAYEPPDDERILGFVLQDVSIAPADAGFRSPAPAQLGWLAATLVLIYPLARWLGLSLRWAGLLTLAFTTLTAILLVTNRFALTLFTPALAGLALGCWGIALVGHVGVRLLNGGWARDNPQARLHGRHAKTVLALFLLAFALRLGGMLHPHARFSDHRLNANNLLEVGLGIIYFTEGLPADASGGQAPYPPGMYLLVAPVQLFVAPDIDGRVFAVQSGVAFLDSLVVVLLWGMLRNAGLGQRSAVMGAALYLVPAPIMASFSVGEYANIGGQVLALPAIGLLAWNCATLARVDEPPGRATRGYQHLRLWVPLLCVGLLGHLGVTLSLGMFLLSAWGLGVIERVYRRGPATPDERSVALGAITTGGILAASSVGIIYYSAPTFTALVIERVAGAAGGSGASESPLLPTIGATLQDVFAPYHRLTPVLVAAGLAGLIILGNRRVPASRARGLVVTLAAWWLGTLIALGLPLITGASRGVRWPHFLYPALCLGAGCIFAALWRRGRAGRLIALCGLLTPISYGLVVWIEQIRDYLHS